MPFGAWAVIGIIAGFVFVIIDIYCVLKLYCGCCEDYSEDFESYVPYSSEEPSASNPPPEVFVIGVMREETVVRYD